jgi:hypothetical protein
MLAIWKGWLGRRVSAEGSTSFIASLNLYTATKPNLYTAGALAQRVPLASVSH